MRKGLVILCILRTENLPFSTFQIVQYVKCVLNLKSFFGNNVSKIGYLNSCSRLKANLFLVYFYSTRNAQAITSKFH